MATPVDIMLWALAAVAVLGATVLIGIAIFLVVAIFVAACEVAENRRAKRKGTGNGE